MKELINNNWLKRTESLEHKITLWLNHLLVLYAFLIPIHNKSKSSLFFLMLLLFLWRGNYWSYLKSTLSNKVIQALLLFYFINLIGFAYTENIDFAKSAMNKVKYIIFPLFFLTFLDKRFSIRIIAAFSLGIFCSELLSYAIRLELAPTEFFFFGHEVYATLLHDPSPFFNHLDHNIGLAVMVSLLLYQLLNYNLSKVSKIFTLVFMISATVNMTFIGSRTGYLLYIMLIMIVLILTYQKNIKKAILISILLIVSISYISYTNSEMVNKRVNKTINSIWKIIDEKNYESSIGKRLALSVYGMDVVKENPILGVGTGDYMDEIRMLIPEEQDYLRHLSEPHNVYVKTLVQFGLIGFLSLLYIFYTLFTYNKSYNNHKNMIIIVTMAIMIIMLPGKFYGYFVLPMFVTLISAFMAHETRNIEWNEFNTKTGLVYIGITLLFLVIGITK